MDATATTGGPATPLGDAAAPAGDASATSRDVGAPPRDAIAAGPEVPPAEAPPRGASAKLPAPTGTTRSIPGRPSWAAPLGDRFEKRAYKPAQGLEMSYRLFKPVTTAGTKYPLVVYLNGYGGLKASLDAPPTLYPDGVMFFLPYFVERHATFMLEPRLPGERTTSAATTWILYDATLLEAIATLVAEFPIDPARIYMTGHSLGGDGTYMIAAKHPNTFAALMPVSSFQAPRALAPALAQHPIWILHGNEERNTVALDWIQKLTAAGARPHYTEHCGGHDGELDYPNPSVWAWLFQQRLGVPEVPPSGMHQSDPNAMPIKCYTLPEFGTGAMKRPR